MTNETLVGRLEAGLIQSVSHRWGMTAIRWKPDDSALFRLLRRLDAMAARELPDGRGR